MRTLKHVNVLAEYHAVERMIAETPTNAVIDRMSMEHRLQSLREEMEEIEKTKPSGIRGTLNFRGKPVIDSYGIAAVFSADAIKAFEKIIVARAASFTSPLSQKGRVPNREQYSLLITGTSKGSFGFELENPVPDGVIPEVHNAASHLQDAINDTMDFFTTVQGGTDEKLADVFADLEERVVNEISGFLTLLADNEATCGLEFGTRSFHFRDVAEVSNGVRRLRKDNIHERDETIHGVFCGALPHKRLFEFKATTDDLILDGKISPSVDEPERINALLDQPMAINVHVTQVGSSKPKYRLTSYTPSPQ
jgi:hypothetical protein